MKTIRYTPDALNNLRRHRSQAKAIMAKIARYAETGAGKVTQLVGAGGARRLRIGGFRAVFEETATGIIVTRIRPRGSVYDD